MIDPFEQEPKSKLNIKWGIGNAQLWKVKKINMEILYRNLSG